MVKYRRIPGEPIEARQWPYAAGDLIEDRDAWPEVGSTHDLYFVTTIHGQAAHLAKGDWILPEPDGIHFYPCKPDVFAKTYEPVERSPMTWHGEPTTLENMDAEMGLRGNRKPCEPIAHSPTSEQIFDCENNIEPERTIASNIAAKHGLRNLTHASMMVDDISHAIKDARAVGAARAAIGFTARIAELECQLRAEGEHTAAANANIDRLNTEIERVMRRQQGPLMGKD